jgi:hypothetical protein
MDIGFARMLKARAGFAQCGLLLLCGFFLFGVPECRAATRDLVVGLEDGWIWQVALLPPEEGWESEAGISALGAVRLAEWKVKDSADGVSGRDIRFHKEPEVTVETAAGRVADWRKRNVSAVLSFGGGREISILRPHLAGAGPVFLSSFGENGNIQDGSGLPDRMLFALDLFRDFRITAFAEYASRILPEESVVAILGDKLDPSLERFSRNLGDFLFSGGFQTAHFWIPGGGMDSFRMIEAETVSSGARVLISWAGSMVVRDIWRGMRHRKGAFEIWYGGEPQPLLRSFDGVVTADQDFPVRTDRTFITLGREIWRRNKTTVRDPGMAGRAYTSCSWLFEAFRLAGTSDPVLLAEAMKRVEGLAFGSQTLSINPATHRPYERSVAFMSVQGREFHPLTVFPVRGPDFLP